MWVRAGVGGLVAVLLVLGLTQLVFPGQAGDGTPMAILFGGLIGGLLNAVLAVGIVLIYRSHRVINFAQTALGFLGALFAYNLTALVGFPFLVSFVIGVAVGAITGLAFDLAFARRFFHAPRLVLTVFTILMIPVLAGTAFQLDFRLPLWPGFDERTIEQFPGRSDIPLPFADFGFRVGGFPLRFGFSHVFAIAVCVLALVGLAAFLRYTRIGIAVRASAENAERARMLGISVNTVSMVVWSVAGALAAVAVISEGAMADRFPYGGGDPQVLLLAIAAAIVARMRSLPLAAAVAVAFTVVIQTFLFSYSDHFALVPVFLLLAIVGGLLLQRERIGRSEEAEATSWRAIEEPRPIPKEMLTIPGLVAVRRAAIAVLAVGVLVFPWVVPPRQANLGGYYAIVAIVLLSLVVLTGWAGQVSLGQFAFVAVGAVLGGALTARVGMSFWLAILIVPVLTAAITALVGFPALRIKGLFLGVATLALAFAAQFALFQARYFDWLLPDEVDRPRLFMLDFDDERSMYYLALGILSLCVLSVAALRRSRPGRLLIGLRENEANVRAFGVNPVRMRLAAFAMSGFLCGIAGILLAHHQRAVSDADFPALLSLNIFVIAILGGVASVLGVMLGVAYLAFVTDFLTDQTWQFILGQTVPVVVLWLAPGGFMQIFNLLRDNVLRIVAQRRQMVVPALFADYDPEALERHLIPLAEPIPGAGAESLSSDRHYRRESVLYGERGQLAETRGRRSDEDAVALGAAARVAEDGES